MEDSIIISSRTDLITYVDGYHADWGQEYGSPLPLVDAIQAADHPRWGTDWREWLDAHATEIKVATALAADTAEEE